MRISCLLASCLLASLPAAAPAAENHNSAAEDVSQMTAAPPLNGQPTLKIAQSATSPTPQQPPSTIFPGNPNAATRQKLTELANRALKTALAETVADTGNVCYTMHTYRFARQTPESDATQLKQHSTCQPAAQFQAKQVAPPVKTTPR